MNTTYNGRRPQILKGEYLVYLNTVFSLGEFKGKQDCGFAQPSLLFFFFDYFLCKIMKDKVKLSVVCLDDLATLHLDLNTANSLINVDLM